MSLIRDHYATTRAHEFGHNIGLGHAGGWGLEYGDVSNPPRTSAPPAALPTHPCYTHLLPSPL